ncbi:hypothetical protein ASPWEDRAFT_43935 [Aspergillus wentii DTO 134E9]|uniref:Uncharacterized protein n=1 Tax=Aspergillus wentii DTO 134E9 TaxID=1073089 RepID=A0A1L9RAI0_ASPWE|nr:uncharacterized protein ASPWEDRAFT_43935 [Aspergillus wentii DTO 134E9]OJJ31909.1 hypothetical protein ASPWEDRAFT_43935 [Aspergillus wentii DTO 134E9]
MSITRYTVPIPADTIILETLDDVDIFVAAHPDTCAYEEHGGYYMKNDTGVIFAITSDELSEEFDRRMADLRAKIESGELSE